MRSFSDLTSLKGRVALVAGGASPQGRAIATTYAELGAAVALLDQPGSEAESIAGALTEKYGVLVTAITAETGDLASIRKVPQRVVDSCGRLDILVNIGLSENVPLDQLNPETWQNAMTTGLTAPFLLIQQAIPALQTSGRGSIINLSTATGIAACATGGGLAQLSRSLAEVLGPAVRVNAVAGGTADDLRGAAAFLASDLGAHVTGQCLNFGGFGTI